MCSCREDDPVASDDDEYLNKKAVATLVYRRRQHIVNLFIWPATSSAEGVPKSQARQGYHLIHWTQSGMTYWAISDLNEAELEEFVREIRQTPMAWTF